MRCGRDDPTPDCVRTRPQTEKLERILLQFSEFLNWVFIGLARKMLTKPRSRATQPVGPSSIHSTPDRGGWGLLDATARVRASEGLTRHDIASGLFQISRETTPLRTSCRIISRTM